MDFQASAELIAIYLDEARAHLAALDKGLLRLEREGVTADVVASLLGPLHTLKGNSGMMGFSSIKEYVHRLEDVLGKVRDGSIVLGPAAFDCLFGGASALRDSIEKGCLDGRETRSLGPEQAELEGLLAGRLPEKAATRPMPAVVVPAGSISPIPLPAPALVPGAGAPPTGRSADVTPARSNMVRVDFSRLDHLLNLVGELIVYRTKLQEAGRSVAPGIAADPAVHDLLDAVHQLTAVSTQLQETIMDVRMLPIRTVFERFPRLVRDLARQQGKEIELILEGEETRVDKAIIDEIGEPLVHLIRNSVDHGIEGPAERAARGKSPTGTIMLSAAQESNQVVITIADDGSGIDVAQVREKAIERRIIAAADRLSDREVIQLIFAEGFSTAEAVTELSGRGVGLDVVVKCMERLNGFIEAETMRGAGTRFTMQLPLTLAIISALMVDVGGHTYAIPAGSVVESLRFRPEEITRIGGRETLRLRDRIVPLFRLGSLFGHEDRPLGAHSYAVVLGRGEKRLGLAVDRLNGQQEVVIKALDPIVSGAGVGLAGATIMGDGRVVLILDVTAFFGDRRLQSARAGAVA
ncbi:MAG: chemotaxis protein CheA [Solirubrobacterales bacterium]